MADCGAVVGVFVAGGGGGILPDAGVGFCHRCKCWVAVFGNRVAVFVAPQGEYRPTGAWDGIQNRMEVEKII